MNAVGQSIKSGRSCGRILLLVVVATAFCLGCTRLAEIPIDGPWVAPGIHAREFERTKSRVSSPLSEHVSFWTDAKGHRVEVFKIVDPAMRYLEGLGYFQRWPETNMGFDDYIQRLAPYTFHLVSMQPTIVVMIPHDFGKASDGRSIAQMVGSPPKQSVSTKYMINHIEYGTTFPYHPEGLWFSPDLRVPPTKIGARTGNEQEIVHPGIKLVITRKGEVCTTKR